MGEFQNLLKTEGRLSEILRPEDFAPADGWANRLAEELGGDLKTTQLRKLFNIIKAIDRTLKGEDEEGELRGDVREKLTMLIPELAYAAGRKVIPREFYGMMCDLLDGEKLSTVGDFRRLVQFLTAFLAYHKLYEG
jgi:CRISPR-associated protein Csm2